MPKAGAPITTERGNPIKRNPARIMFAAEQLRLYVYTKARTEIMQRWGVSETTAERDLRAAKQLIAKELDAIEVRAAELRRNERLADKAEELADKAADEADFLAAATLQKSAIAASREVSRLSGAYSAAKVSVEHSGTVAVEAELQIDAILAILDEQGLAAMRLVQEQIERAKAEGRLLPAPVAEVEDDDEPPPGDDEPGAPSGVN